MARKTKRAIRPSKASNSKTAATTTPPSPNANLSCMPIEVVEMIVYWINYLPSTQPKPQNQQTNPVYKADDEDRDIRGLRKFRKQSNGNPLNDIRSLASVNRSFYQICTPYLFEGLNFKGLAVNRLTSTLEETIKKHSDHVQKIQWRVSDSKSASEEREELLRSNKSRYDRSWKSQWGPKARSGLLLKILKSCPNLVDLDVDLDPRPSMPAKTPEVMRARNFQDSSRSSSYDQMPNIFIKPISQLTSLTHLSLTCPNTRPSYTESFLVDILSNLHQLRSFGCSRIAADRLGTEKAPQSPLGIRLASLTHLVELHLDQAACLDARWNQYKWKSSLKALSLIHCYSGSDSVADLHGFVKLFKSSLTTLILVDVPEPLDSGPDATIQFKLPRLINLEISTWSLGQFPRAFQHSKNLSWLSLGDEALSRPRTLLRLIRDRLWPKLKTFEITSVESCTREEVSGLEDLCREYGIEIIFHTEFYSSEEDEDEDEDDDDDGDHSGCDLSYFYKSKKDPFFYKRKKDPFEGYFKKRPRCAYADSYDSCESDF